MRRFCFLPAGCARDLWIALAVVLLPAMTSVAAPNPAEVRTRLLGWTQFTGFTREPSGPQQETLLSPVLNPGFPWEELVVSWNATAPPGSWIHVEAMAIDGDLQTRWYVLGRWSTPPSTQPRASEKGQRDDDGRVSTDTLVLVRPRPGARLRITLGGTNSGARPALRLVTASFWRAGGAVAAPGAALARVPAGPLAVPERRQTDWPEGEAWCSPTSLGMVLEWWSGQRERPEWNLTVPALAAGVHDPSWQGTGNWVFNTAFAGGLPGMRAYVTRLRGADDLGLWIAAGGPVIASVSFDLLVGREQDAGTGHLVVVVGLTDTGDVIINDPYPDARRENRVRKVIPRERFVRAWQRSHQTAYLVHPEDWPPPVANSGPWLSREP